MSTLGWIYDPVFLPYTSNNEIVSTVRHALAINEKRAFYSPVLWGDQYRESQNIKQVWFAGVHSDVGGGYPERESGLAKITLQWMIEEAASHGLLVDNSCIDRYVLGLKKSEYVGPDASAQPHESLQGLWKLVQGVPRKQWDPQQKRKVIRVAPEHRTIAAGSAVHHTVLEKVQPGKYCPTNLQVTTAEELRERFEIV